MALISTLHNFYFIYNMLNTFPPLACPLQMLFEYNVRDWHHQRDIRLDGKGGRMKLARPKICQ